MSDNIRRTSKLILPSVKQKKYNRRKCMGKIEKKINREVMYLLVFYKYKIKITLSHMPDARHEIVINA